MQFINKIRTYNFFYKIMDDKYTVSVFPSVNVCWNEAG